MSLQDEIAKNLYDFEIDGRLYTAAADETINKVLDAVENAINERQNTLLAMYESMPENEQAMLVAGLAEACNAANTLRPKS